MGFNNRYGFGDERPVSDFVVLDRLHGLENGYGGIHCDGHDRVRGFSYFSKSYFCSILFSFLCLESIQCK